MPTFQFESRPMTYLGYLILLQGEGNYVSNANGTVDVHVVAWVKSEGSSGKGVTCQLYFTSPAMNGPTVSASLKSGNNARVEWDTTVAQRNVPFTVTVGGKFWGSGSDPLTSNGTTGSTSSPFRRGETTFVLPAMPRASAPTTRFRWVTPNVTAEVGPNASANTNGYMVQWNRNAIGWYNLGTATPTIWLSPALQANSKYYFRSGANNVYYPDYVYGAQIGPYYTTPARPTGLQAVRAPNGTQLAWSNNALDGNGVIIQAATNAAFTTGVKTIHNGVLTSSWLYQQPSSSAEYYRVATKSPAGQTSWSNAAGVTMVMYAPNPPTNFTRTGSYDSNTVVLSWTNNSATNRPYAGLILEIANNSAFTGATTVSLPASATTYTYYGTYKERVYARIWAFNAIGSSSKLTLSTATQTPAPTINGAYVSKSKCYCTVTTTACEWGISGYDNTYIVRSRWRADATSAWGAWVTRSTFTGAVTNREVSFLAPSSGQVQFDVTVNTTGSVTRTANAVAATTGIVGFSPLAPTSVSWANNILSVTLPADDVGTATRSMTVVAKDVLTGNTTTYGPYSYNGAARTVTINVVPKSAITNITATVSSPFSTNTASRTYVIDLDKLQVHIGSRRHIIATISESSVVTPVSVNRV